MALPEMSVVCTNCRARIRAQPKRTTLAFLKFHCFSCRKDFVYPLTSGYRTTYWVLVILTVLVFAAALAVGRITFPGIITVLGAIALVKDAGIRKQVAAAGPGIDRRPAAGTAA
jgi:hypothetical protein